MRITDSYCEDLAVIIIFFKSMQSSKTLISYTSKERRYQPLAFFSNREQDSTDISKVFPLTEVNINQEVE